MTKYIISAACLFWLILNPALSQDEPWVVSAADAGIVNPLTINPKNVAAGKNIYFHSCVACHGANADGKGLITSASFLTSEFQGQTDGAIYHKIITGRNTMPSFRSVLKEEEIWSVINYLRILVNPAAVPPATDVQIALTTDDDRRSVTARVYSPDSVQQPLSEVDVHFYVKRDLGLMQFGGFSNFTGPEGDVTVNFPARIIGDQQGNVTIIARVENNLLFNDNEASVSKSWGVPLKAEDEVFKRRALWGARDRAPVWLLLTVNGILAAVWGTIVYVIYNMFRIKKAGKVFIK